MSAVKVPRRPQRSNTDSSWRDNVPRNKSFNSGQRDSDPPSNQMQVLSKDLRKKKELCAAWQKHYQDCGALNHFPGSYLCREPAKCKPVHGEDELSDDSDGYFLYVESASAIDAEQCQCKIFAKMRLRETEVIV